VKQNWHTGFIVVDAYIRKKQWPERLATGKAPYYEVGWGDEDYYIYGRKPLQALFLPTESVLCVGLLYIDPAKIYAAEKIITLKMSRTNFNKLLTYFSRAYKQNADGKLIKADTNAEAFYTFYKAKKKFHFFRTCNKWTAEGLAAAEVNIKKCCIISPLLLWRRLKIYKKTPARSKP